ncbi:response regulator [Bacillus sp. BRMEA1]|uniref:response regulator n=1 Tax=Neobacillus endophyticus TaxID=2738405 RepID=UPI001565037F|nr:response regulator [Neobacillus endophyticus]NRD76915.1 response regulator [Neobacillus endophyticus]
MKKVLIVDDSKFMRNMLKTHLKKKDCLEIFEAENGAQGLEWYKINSPHIVIMDITMPVLNGIDTLKEIMKIDPKANVVMCSAMGQKSIILETLKIGAKDFVVKPYFNSIHSIIEKFC